MPEEAWVAQDVYIKASKATGQQVALLVCQQRPEVNEGSGLHLTSHAVGERSRQQWRQH